MKRSRPWHRGHASASTRWSRLYDFHAAGDGNAGSTRYFSYFPSGRLRYSEVDDARGQYTRLYNGYDHRGRRVYALSLTPSGARTDRYFFYDRRDQLIGVLELPQGGSSSQELYFWNETEAMFRFTVQNFYSVGEFVFLYNDHLGTPRVGVSTDNTLSNPSVTYRAPRGPFMEGSPVTQSGRPVNLRFPGQWADEGTAAWGTTSTLLDTQFSDLVNNHAREYEPGMGLYSAVEPALLSGAAGQLEPMTYAHGNPSRFMDPTGAVPVCLFHCGPGERFIFDPELFLCNEYGICHTPRRPEPCPAPGRDGCPAIVEIINDVRNGGYMNPRAVCRNNCAAQYENNAHCLWICENRRKEEFVEDPGYNYGPNYRHVFPIGFAPIPPVP